MTFNDLPSGAPVFIDTNTFLYAILGDPTYGAACKALLDRVELQDIQGVTSAHVLSKVAHRAMTIEACSRFAWPGQGIGNRLRRHPDEVKQLVSPRRALDEISGARVALLPVAAAQVFQAADLSQQLGLLSGYALIVTVMRDHNLSHLASLDADFDRVPGLTRYAPA